MKDLVEKQLISDGVIPVLSVKTTQEGLERTQEILRGGLRSVEVTLRSDCALETILHLCQRFPDAYIGAGTVVTAEQAKQAIQNGAKFIVSPGWSEAVWAVCKTADIFYLPGCVTPSEIMTAMSFGITTVKFFPASVYGGAAALRALSAPFSTVKFVPTGGVELASLPSYLSLSCVAAVGGSWMISNEGKTEELVKQTVDAVKNVQK